MRDDRTEPTGIPRHERRAKMRSDPELRGHHDALFTLARVTELRDLDTGSHGLRIRMIVEQIARTVGIDDAEALGYDAMLHDVGKLGVPREILRKPGQLTVEERRQMEAHTVHGERILAQRSSMHRAARIARSHHECWDGSGYPDGLRGNEIPVEARITTGADILDALVADRCYKEPHSYRESLERVCSLEGSMLDPMVVRALKTCDQDGSLRRILETADSPSPEPDP